MSEAPSRRSSPKSAVTCGGLPGPPHPAVGGLAAPRQTPRIRGAASPEYHQRYLLIRGSSTSAQRFLWLKATRRAQALLFLKCGGVPPPPHPAAGGLTPPNPPKGGGLWCGEVSEERAEGAGTPVRHQAPGNHGGPPRPCGQGGRRCRPRSLAATMDLMSSPCGECGDRRPR